MKTVSGGIKLLLSFAMTCAMASVGRAQTFTVLYSFTGGTDGGGVWGSVVMDKQGNLYGTTTGGGAYGYGTVFELSPNGDGTWTEIVLHSFKNGDPDGQEPEANLVLDAAGNLYGTTPTGAKHNVGSAFELTPGSSGWSLTLLYSFGGYKGDAGPPRGGLLMD
ncbi:MAG TPA: choice-of-anchor tandem repeat GloVer-containing protein, partial [Candidatus Sulfotelmatobacter sp.]